jgi:hypothetical protein
MRFRSIGALVTAALAFPAAAVASIDPKPVTVGFDLTLRGTETTTWHMSAQGHPPCAASVRTDGDQTIRFHTSRPQRVWVERVFSLPPDFKTEPSVTATAERNMEIRTGKPVIVNRQCVKIVPLPPYVEQGCAASHDGTIILDLGFDAKDQLRIRGASADYGAGRPLSTLYPSCPMLVPISGYAPNSGNLLAAAGELNENGLFGKSKVLKMSSSHVYPFSARPGIHGQSIVTYNLTLRRIVVPTRAKDLRAIDRANRAASPRNGNPAPKHTVATGPRPCTDLIVADGGRTLRVHASAPRSHLKDGIPRVGPLSQYQGGHTSLATPPACGRPVPFTHDPRYGGGDR